MASLERPSGTRAGGKGRRGHIARFSPQSRSITAPRGYSILPDAIIAAMPWKGMIRGALAKEPDGATSDATCVLRSKQIYVRPRRAS
jgi:hypothetical protein